MTERQKKLLIDVATSRNRYRPRIDELADIVALEKKGYVERFIHQREAKSRPKAFFRLTSKALEFLMDR